MSDLDALLAGIVVHPHESLRWLIVADWLDDHGQTERAELLRLHRMLLDSWTDERAIRRSALRRDRSRWHARVVELLDSGVAPCVPRHVLTLPGGVPLVGHFIPPGSFPMGGRRTPAEKPVRRVTLTHGFFAGVSPVTQAQWAACTDASTSRITGDDRMPVHAVTWESAVAVCQRMSELTGGSVRLPTEAEWEYACRAGTTTEYHWGDVPDAARMNYHGEYMWNGSAVGAYRQQPTVPGAFAPNPWGLWDVHGNVWEWCADRYDAGFYERSPEADPVCDGIGHASRAMRGGCWMTQPFQCRSACRFWESADRPAAGFRVVFTTGDAP